MRGEGDAHGEGRSSPHRLGLRRLSPASRRDVTAQLITAEQQGIIQLKDESIGGKKKKKENSGVLPIVEAICEFICELMKFLVGCKNAPVCHCICPGGIQAARAAELGWGSPAVPGAHSQTGEGF